MDDDQIVDSIESGDLVLLGIKNDVFNAYKRKLKESFNEIRPQMNNEDDEEENQENLEPTQPFQLIPQKENGKNEWWPQIPLGQLIWALISDTWYIK